MKLRLAFLGSGAAMLAAACALLADIPDSVRVAPASGGSCSRTIRIRALNAVDSVAIADVALPVYLGAIDHLREIQETGGIRGCKVEYEFTPTDYSNPGKAVEIYERWKAAPDWNEVVAVFGVGSADALALGPKVTKDKRVLIPMAYNGTLASPKPVKKSVIVPEVNLGGTPPQLNETNLEQAVESQGYPYVFFSGTDYSTAIRVAMFHVSATDRGARIGWAHCAGSEFCLNPLPAGKSYAKELGLLIGRDLTPLLTDTAATYAALLGPYFVEEATQAALDRSYRPVSWLWSGNLTAGTFFLAAGLGALEGAAKPSPSVPDEVWAQAQTLMKNARIIANNYGFDESLAASFCPSIPSGPDPCKRIFGIMPFLGFGDTSTGSTEMPKIVALHDKWRLRDAKEPYNDAAAIVAAGLPVPTMRSIRYVQGYMNVKLFKMGMERLIDQGREITGESLKVALETFQSEDTGGVSAPLSFSPDDHRPQSAVSIYNLEFASRDAGTRGSLKNVSPTRHIALQPQWLGW